MRVAVIAAVLGSGMAVVPATAAAPAPPDAVSLAVGRAVPGATGKVVRLGGGDRELRVRIPRSALDGPGSGAPNSNARLHDIAWRIGLAAGSLAADGIAIKRVRIADERGRTTKRAEYQQWIDYVSPEFAGDALHPGLGTVDAALMRQQAESNLAVLRNGLPAGSVVSSQTELVEIDSARRRVGVAYAIRVHSLPALREWQGDLIGGADNGLTGSERAVAEGVGIVVEDDRGRVFAGFNSVRQQSGAIDLPRAFGACGGGATRLRYENLTGGPNAAGFAMSCPVSLPSLRVRFGDVARVVGGCQAASCPSPLIPKVRLTACPVGADRALRVSAHGTRARSLRIVLRSAAKGSSRVVRRARLRADADSRFPALHIPESPAGLRVDAKLRSATGSMRFAFLISGCARA